MIVKLVTFPFQNTKGNYLFNPDLTEIAGQSNGTGFAPNAGLPGDLVGAQTDIEIFNPYTGVNAWQALNPGVNGQGAPNYNSATFGVEGRLMKLLRDVRNKPQRLIKYTVPGTWLALKGSGVVDWNVSSTNEYYKLSNDNYTLARSTLADTRPPARYIWVQGENDATVTGDASAYQTNLQNFIAAKRALYGWAQMPFIIVRLGDSQSFPFKSTVIAAQNTVATQANNFIVSADGLTTIGDATHYDAASIDVLANRIFTVITNYGI